MAEELDEFYIDTSNKTTFVTSQDCNIQKIFYDKLIDVL